MIKLNLLPQKEKQNFKLRLLNRKIVLIGMIIILALIIIAIGLFNLSLDKKPEQTVDIEQLEQEIVLLNKEISEIQKFQISQYSEILEKIIEQKPANIKLLSLQIQNKKINLNGHAQAREQMFAFEKALKQVFKQVDSPLSNLTKPIDLDFTFTITYEN